MMAMTDTVRLKVSDIYVDSERFQFKASDGDGVTAELRSVSVFDPDAEGVVSVWEDPNDGQTYVVNGHHRLELARRVGYPTLRCRYLEVSIDRDARLRGALINIREGRGTAVDCAKLFRDSGYTPADLASLGVSIVRGTLARDGMALAALHPALFLRVVREEMTVARGALIGRELPDDVDQLALLQSLDERDLTDREVAELIRLVRAAPRIESTQESLFGVETIRQNLMVEKAALAAYVKDALGKDERILGFVAKRERQATLEKAGNRINTERSGELATEASQVRELFERLSGRSGPIAEALNREARRLAGGQDSGAVRRDLLGEIRQIVTKTLLKAGGSSETVEDDPTYQPPPAKVSTGSYEPLQAYRRREYEDLKLEIPDYALDKHTGRGKRMGRGVEHWRTEGCKLIPEDHGFNAYEEEATRLREKYGGPIVKKPGRKNAAAAALAPKAPVAPRKKNGNDHPELFANGEVVGTFESRSGHGTYTVKKTATGLCCNCKGWIFNKTCRHVTAC